MIFMYTIIYQLLPRHFTDNEFTIPHLSTSIQLISSSPNRYKPED